MRLSALSEDRQMSAPSFRVISGELEEVLSRIDVDEVIPTRAPLTELAPGRVMVREGEVYDDTVDEYRTELSDTGRFLNPSGDPDDSYFPWGIAIGDDVVVMDGTHRVEAMFREGRPIMVHVFQDWD